MSNPAQSAPPIDPSRLNQSPSSLPPPSDSSEPRSPPLRSAESTSYLDSSPASSAREERSSDPTVAETGIVAPASGPGEPTSSGTPTSSGSASSGSPGSPAPTSSGLPADGTPTSPVGLVTGQLKRNPEGEKKGEDVIKLSELGGEGIKVKPPRAVGEEVGKFEAGPAGRGAISG